MKIGDVGVIQKSKHPWNNGKKVTITDNGRFETGYNRKGNPIQIKVFTAADDQGNLFLLGESNFKPLSKETTMTTINLKAMIQEWNKLDSLYYQWDGICRRDWLKKLYNQANDLYRQIGLRALECTMEELTDLTKSEFEFIYEAACRARRNV